MAAPKSREEHKARLLAALDALRAQVVSNEVHSVVAIATSHSPGDVDKGISAKALVHVRGSHAAPIANTMAAVIVQFTRDHLVPTATFSCPHCSDDEEQAATKPTLN